MRAKVEHPFLVIKRLFGFAKTRYRGLDKNSNRLFVTCVLTNLSPHTTAIVTHYVGDIRPIKGTNQIRTLEGTQLSLGHAHIRSRFCSIRC